MTTVGIIAEFNPFHNGHKHLINQAKKITKADYVIVIMSGNFLQRGEASIYNKFTRAKMAVSEGVDLVIELPVAYSTGSALDFSNGAINILDKLNSIDYLCFGSENIDTVLFNKITDVIINEPAKYKLALKDNLSKGASYPMARENALADYFKSENISSFISSPNNILAIEYYSSIKRINSSIKPIPIPRLNSAYHSIDISNTLSSATSIRTYIEDNIKNISNEADFSNLMKAIAHTIPQNTLEILIKEYNKTGPVFPNYILPFLQYSILTHNNLSHICDIDHDLSNKITKISPYNKYDDIINLLKSKNYTSTRITRGLIHCILNYTRDNRERFINNNYGFYANILAFRKDSSKLIKEISIKSQIPLITKKANFQSYFNEYPNINYSVAKELWDFDLLASNIYNCLLYNMYSTEQKNDLETTPIIV